MGDSKRVSFWGRGEGGLVIASILYCKSLYPDINVRKEQLSQSFQSLF